MYMEVINKQIIHMSSENQTKMSYTNYPISQGGDLYDT